MTPLNRVDTLGRINVIEHGWKFYKERPWTLGVIYWTGQDYRGEPNPMVWPATGSQFGILDYCCFPKDEAFYLKSVWTEKPTVHICGPCRGEVWVYSNCDKVTLYADGKSLGKKVMPKDGHLVWKAKEKATKYTAKGYVAGKMVASDKYPSTPSGTTVSLSRTSFKPDGQDIVVLDIDSAEQMLEVSVEGACFLGWGNGNPGFKEVERPVGELNSLTIKPFSNKAQVIIRSLEGSKKPATVTVAGQRIKIEIL
jgi:beta-galactosidase